jgi:hypothetical protein
MLFRLIGFGVRVWGCLFVAYWALMIGIATVIIISTYLRPDKHHPEGKAASQYDHKIAKTWKGDE